METTAERMHGRLNVMPLAPTESEPAPQAEHAYFVGGAIKAIGINGDGKIGGYLVAYGNPNQTDTAGEWFTNNTDYALDYYPERPILYHHGLTDMKAVKIGVIYKITPDEHGLYAEAMLDVNHEDPTIRMYARKAYDMVMKGKLGWSSGSAPNLVDVHPSGEIKRWPIVEGSLTPTPAEPKRTTVSAIKSAISALETDETELPKEPSAKGDDVVSPVESAFVSIKSENPKRKMSVKMGTIEALEKAGLSPEQIIASMKELEAAGIGAVVAEVEPEAEDAVMATEDVAAAVPPMTDAATMAKAQINNPTVQQVKEMITAAMKSAPAKVPVPGLTAADPSKSYQNDLVVFSKTQSLDAADLSFMVEMRRMIAAKTGQRYDPDIKLYREMAEKAQAAIKSGALDLGIDEETGANKNNRVMAIKSNELDNTGTAAAAGNWVPELWSAQLWRRFRVPTRVPGQFQVVEMPSATYDLPVEDSDPTVYYVPETTDNSQLSLASGAAIPSSVVGAGKVQLVSKKLAARVGFSTEMMEDSIIQFIPQIRDQAMLAIENAIENVLINGDTTNSAANINGTPTGTTDKFLAFNAMRYLSLITNASANATPTNASGASPTLQMIRSARAKLISTLNNYALDPNNLFVLCDQYTWHKMLNVDEILVWANNGLGSTVNTGIVPNVDGMVVIPSAQLPLTDATGVVSGTASDNVYGTIIVAAKPAWKMGYRRNITSSLDYLPYYDSYQLTNTVRIAFKNKDNYANALIYGLATS